MKKRLIQGTLRGSFDLCVVLAALLGALFCFLDLVEAPVDKQAIGFCACLWALLCLPVFWFSRRPGLWVWVLLALYGGAVYYYLENFVRGAVTVGCDLSQVYAKTLPGAVAYYPLERMEASQAIACSTLFLKLASAPAALALAWTAARRHSFFGVFILTAPTVLASAVILRTPPVLPLLALIACWAVLALAGGGGRHGPASAAKVGWLAAAPAALVLLLAAWLAPMNGSYQRPARVEAARLWLHSLGQSGAENGQISGPAPAIATGQTRLDTAGDLHFRGYTALRLYSERQEKTYLRGFAAEKYTGASWRQAYTVDYQNALDGADFDPLNLLADVTQSNFPTQSAYQMIVEQLQPSGAYLYTPYGLVTRPEEIEGAYLVRDGYIQMDDRGQGRYLLKAVSVPPLGQSMQTPNRLEEAERRYRQFVYDNCLQVPENLAPVLEEIARQEGIPHADESSWYEAADKTADYIRQAARYDPAPGRLPRGWDYTEYFLTQSKAGYCMHFATAGVMLLRSRGVPARYAEGYLVNDADFASDGWADVKDSRAHAWAEIYVDGVGWVPLEMTPGYGGGPLAPEEPEAAEEEQPDQPQPEEPEEQPTELEQQPPEAEKGQTLGQKPTGRLIWFGAAAFALALALAARPALARCWRRRKFQTKDPNRRVLELYRRVQKLTPYCAPPDCVEELALKARFSRYGLTEEEAERAQLAAESMADQIWRQSGRWRRFVLRWLRALL